MAERLGNTCCTVGRESVKLPDLAQTSRIYRQLLAATFSIDAQPETRERVAIVRTLRQTIRATPPLVCAASR
jgi:hypothetical protein